MLHWLFLICLLITHCFIDGAGSTVSPLLKRLAVHHGAADWAMGIVGAALYASISFSQPLFGYLYDRYRAYWIMPVAAIAIGTCLAFTGIVGSFGLLVLLVIGGGLACGAFHPIGTAMAGSLTERRRPLMIGVFVCGGAFGVAAGPWFVTRVVNAYGLSATVWLLAGAVPACITALLAWALYRRMPHSQHDRTAQRMPIRRDLLSRPLVVLYCMATLRAFSIYGCVVGMSFLMREKIADSSQALLQTGNIMALLALATGLGGLLSGVFVRPESEKRGLIISLMLGGPLLAVFPLLTGPWMIVVLIAGGVIVNSTVPLVTAIGQRLMPGASAVASSIFMGVSWGVGGVLGSLVVTAFGGRFGYANTMPLIIAAGLLGSLLATLALPRIIRPADSSSPTPH